MSSKLSYTIEQVKAAALQAMCMSDMCKLLGLIVHGANYSTINKIIEAEQIDISHFDVKATYNRNKLVRTHDNVFCIHSTCPRAQLNYYAKRFSIMEYRCRLCGIVDEYNGLPLSLQLDHINGVADDNRLENLRWLCPNCHSQTATYGGKNK